MKKEGLTKVKKFFKRPAVGWLLTGLGLAALIVVSNLYLQWSQNSHSLELAFNFAFSWHVEKFFLGCFVLLVVLVLLVCLCGSAVVGGLFYSFVIFVLGYADYLKMTYREEPIYPDDLKMITEFGMLKDLVGTGQFVVILLLALLFLGLAGYRIYRSLRLPKKVQLLRFLGLLCCSGLLLYFNDFNSEDNLLRKAYDKTALWIPYSQKMNYYNVGFVGGFLYNLEVEAMAEPAGYSEAAIQEIVTKYQEQAAEWNQTAVKDQPNIIYVMSESFSDPSLLEGIEVKGEPLADYYAIADETYSGRMLSQNYGGGTANIEFEALTGFSMELMNAQMTTPYTMLVSDLGELPSVVSNLNQQGYQTTAIHPYNTSMYKRKDVYQKLGFQEFLDESTMQYTDKIENNQYISDGAAYQEVLSLLADGSDPQFVHLVTMQTHMPYGGKYDTLNYSASGNDNNSALANYLQDIAYSSEALKNFLAELEQLDRRTLVVFWGDHLPGIYSEAIQEANEGHQLHETQFLMYDTADELTEKAAHETVTSPFYFAADLMAQAQQPTTGFYQLLLTLQEAVPAFEKGFYYQGEQWHEQAQLTQAQRELYQEYQMIQYDIVAGKQYSLQQHFYETAAK